LPTITTVVVWVAAEDDPVTAREAQRAYSSKLCGCRPRQASVFGAAPANVPVKEFGIPPTRRGLEIGRRAEIAPKNAGGKKNGAAAKRFHGLGGRGRLKAWVKVPLSESHGRILSNEGDGI